MTIAAASPHRHTLLLVDDYEPLREAFQRMLEAAGYHVEAVGTGHAALAAVASVQPCLVFLDVELPDMRCAEIMRQLAGASDRRVPIILISGDPEELAAIEAAAAGALVKPIDRQTLLAAVARHAQCHGIPHRAA